jgi:hypothetical protein
MGKISDSVNLYSSSFSETIKKNRRLLNEHGPLIVRLEEWEKEQTECNEPVNISNNFCGASVQVNITDYRPDILRELCRVVGCGYEITFKHPQSENKMEIYYQFKDQPVVAIMEGCPGPGEDDPCRIIRNEEPRVSFALVCENKN